MHFETVRQIEFVKNKTGNDPILHKLICVWITEVESFLTPSDDLGISAQGKRPVEEEILFFKKRCVDNDILQICQTMNKDKKLKQISNDMQDGCKG